VNPLQYTMIERGKEAPLEGISGLEIFRKICASLDYPWQDFLGSTLAGIPLRWTGTK